MIDLSGYFYSFCDENWDKWGLGSKLNKAFNVWINMFWLLFCSILCYVIYLYVFFNCTIDRMPLRVSCKLNKIIINTTKQYQEW